MISMDVRHPDIEQFTTIKQDLSKVTGANISIQLRDDFMEAVKTDGDYILRWPCDTRLQPNDEIPYNTLTPIHFLDPDTFAPINKVSLYFKKIKARDLWNIIIKAAHTSAEPGLMFLDKHWDYSPDGVYPQYRGVTTNP